LAEERDRTAARPLYMDARDAGRPDLGTVDTLARLTLLARRQGVKVLVRNASPELCGLLDLAGLAEVIPAV
jgi:hypothetical protein